MTETTAAPARYPGGTLARFTRDVDDLDPWASRRHYKGDTFTVEEFYPAGDPDADSVEVAMTAAEADARQLPSPADLASFLGSVACTEHDDLDVEETEQGPDGEGTVALIGTAENRLRFYAVVAVLRVEECDF